MVCFIRFICYETGCNSAKDLFKATKHGETEWNDEMYIFFFYKPISVS